MEMARIRSTVFAVVMLQLLASESLCVAQAPVCRERIQELILDWQHIAERNEELQRKMEPLTYKEVAISYLPSCKPNGSFQKKQCFYEKACWCSQSDGSLIEGSFQQGTDLDCGKD